MVKRENKMIKFLKNFLAVGSVIFVISLVCILLIKWMDRTDNYIIGLPLFFGLISGLIAALGSV
jgi:hypothetical protein